MKRTRLISLSKGNGEPWMKKMFICLIGLLTLAASPTHADEALQYFNLGMKSTITSKKIRYFTRALELNPNLAGAYEKRGFLYYIQEKYDKVIQDFQTYLKVAPPKTEAYLMLGLGYLKSGIYGNAIQNFSHAIEMDPTRAAPYANRAEAYRLLGYYDNAIRDSTRAIQLGKDPRSEAEAYRTRARAFRKLGRGDEAAADTISAYWSDPGVWHYSKRGKTLRTEDLRLIGLINIIGITFLFFVLKLRPPGDD
jgi:tetratricopeptide (TPR) repeat protein